MQRLKCSDIRTCIRCFPVPSLSFLLSCLFIYTQGAIDTAGADTGTPQCMKVNTGKILYLSVAQEGTKLWTHYYALEVSRMYLPRAAQLAACLGSSARARERAYSRAAGDVAHAPKQAHSSAEAGASRRPPVQATHDIHKILHTSAP